LELAAPSKLQALSWAAPAFAKAVAELLLPEVEAE
jgi:hypothetical protein